MRFVRLYVGFYLFFSIITTRTSAQWPEIEIPKRETSLGCYARFQQMLDSFQPLRFDLEGFRVIDAPKIVRPNESYRAKWERTISGPGVNQYWLYFRVQRCPTDRSKLEYIRDDNLSAPVVVPTKPKPAD